MIKKKIQLILLCTILILKLMPTTVFAENDTAFYIGNAIKYADNDDSLWSLSPTTQLNNITMEVWVKADTLPTNGGVNYTRIMYNGDSSANGYGIYLDNNTPCILMGGVVFASLSNEVLLTTSQWYHLAAVRDNGAWSFYINGTKYVPTNNTSAPNPISDANTFSIGNSSYSDENFTGSIDEVRFWTVARTEQQIKENMYIKLHGNESGLLAYYNFDQEDITSCGDNTEITMVTDVAGGDNNLTIAGFALNGDTSNFVPSVRLGTFALANNAYSVCVDDENVRIPIVRTGGSEGSVIINYQTIGGTAIAGTDYESASGSVTFAEGETSKEVSVIIHNSSIALPKSFGLEISGQNGIDIGTQNSATVTIRPEPTVTSVTINPSTASVIKGGSKTFNASVVGDNDPDQTVNWTVEGGISGTNIDTSGVLTVATDEIATMITVKATSTLDATKSCTVPVEVLTEATPVSIQYPVTYGQNGKWAKDSGKGLGFTADVDYSKFTGVSVDDETVSSDDFTSERGSTIVMLKPSYLETLSIGEHTLRLNFTDGYVETSFTISGYVDTPKTGDNASPMRWLGIALLSGAEIAVCLIIRRSRQDG